MRLLLLESEPRVVVQVQTLFSFPFSLDTVSSIPALLKNCQQQPYDFLLVCRVEWLTRLQTLGALPPLVFLPRKASFFDTAYTASFQKEKILQFHSLQMQPSQYLVSVGKRQIWLRKKEYTLLETFLSYPEKTLRSVFLARQLWDNSYDLQANKLHQHIRLLRQALKAASAPVCIRVVYGVGYRLEAL